MVTIHAHCVHVHTCTMHTHVRTYIYTVHTHIHTYIHVHTHTPISTELSGGDVPTPEQIELRLVQSKRDFECPPPFSTVFDEP